MVWGRVSLRGTCTDRPAESDLLAFCGVEAKSGPALSSFDNLSTASLASIHRIANRFAGRLTPCACRC